jgi:hypothetical protein
VATGKEVATSTRSLGQRSALTSSDQQDSSNFQRVSLFLIVVPTCQVLVVHDSDLGAGQMLSLPDHKRCRTIAMYVM